MLQLFHRYQTQVIGLVVIVAIMLSMSFFGVGSLDGRQEVAVITVNGEEVNYEEFNRESQQLRRRYQAMFGQLYPQIEKNLKINQQVVDRIIANKLLDERVEALNIAASGEDIRATVMQLFGGNFSKPAYSSLLSDLRMNAEQFESMLADTIRRDRFGQILQDAAFATEAEAAAKFRRQESSFAVQYAALEPGSVISTVADPSDDEVQRYYEENQDKFEIAPRIAYNYLVIDPQQNLDLVEVSEDEIEIYYDENQSRFKNAEKVKARHIQLNFPAENNPQEMAAVKERAQELHSRVQAGEDISALALQHSDDVASKVLGGDIGWVERGKFGKEFDTTVFKLKQPGVAEIVAAPYGYHVVRIDEYVEPSPKPLAEVRDQIIAEIKKSEAPGYALAKAEGLLEKWRAERAAGRQTSLLDFAAAQGMTAKSSVGLLTDEQDPEPSLAGLTAAVADADDGDAVLVELGESSILAEITERKDAEVKPLADVRAEIISTLKQSRAAAEAAERGAALIEAVKGGGDFTSEAAKRGFKVESANISGKAAQHEGVLQNAELRNRVFAATEAPRLIEQVFESGEKKVVAQVTKVTLPAAEPGKAELVPYREQESRELANIFLQSVINRAKKSAEIDLHQSVALEG